MDIPLYKIDITDKEIMAINKVIHSGKLSRGSVVEEFEKKFAKYIGKKFAVAVNSGTSGLHLAVRTLGWGKGDEILTTPFSYIASSNCLLFESATPVFIDINPNTLNIDIEKIEEKITPKTKGILLVHIFGLPVDYQKLKAIKDKYKLEIIEDSCEAIGKPNDKFMISRLGEVSVYGFYENKQMTSGGEGGMIVTDNENFASICKSLRDQGRSNKEDWISNVMLGFNFRMTEIQAAFGIEQLKRVDLFLKKREKIASKYFKFLKDIPGLVLAQNLDSGKRSWFVYFVLLKDKETRDKLHISLKNKGVQTSIHYFTPINHFPAYSFCKDNFSVSDDISDRLLVLPMFNSLSDNELIYIANSIKESL